MAIQTDLITDSTGLKSVNVGDVVDGHCTAWCNFDGTTGTIRASFNVASVVRNAAGEYTITFATPMANANYTVGPSVNGIYGVDRMGYSTIHTVSAGAAEVAPATSSFRVLTSNTSRSAGIDYKYTNINVFGGK